MAMTENARNVLNYLKEHNGENLTALDVAEALGLTPRSVNGTFTSFCKEPKNWGFRDEQEIEKPEGGHKTVKYLRLTEAGLNFDPDATQE